MCTPFKCGSCLQCRTHPHYELQHLHQPLRFPGEVSQGHWSQKPCPGCDITGLDPLCLGGGAGGSPALCPKAGASLPPQAFSSFRPEVEGPLPLLQVWMWALSSLRWPPSCPVPAAVFSVLSPEGLAHCPLPPPPCKADDSPGYSKILAGSA